MSEVNNGVPATTAISGIFSSSMVREQLEEILASPFFHSSKRCSQMLRYIMEQFILDPSAKLKERTIGVEVFSRNPDYDTAGDTIVRSTAGEIRKRLAQYYAQRSDAALLITLPAGSYFPVIRVGRHDAVSPVELKSAPLESVVPIHAARKSPFLRWKWLAVLMLSAGLTGAVGLARHLRTGPEERFWGPVRAADLPPIICLGDTTRILIDRGDVDAGAEESQVGIRHKDHLALADVLALNSFVSFLSPLTGKPDVRNAATTNFADLQKQPAILIGDQTDQWTMRAMKFLRFQFQEGNGPGIVEMIDSRNPSTPIWQIDFKAPPNQIPKQYVILARFTDPVTNQPTVIDAGAGPKGTIAGAECLTSAACLQDIADRAPYGWEKRNIEIIMETETVKGVPGPAQILRVYVW
jgi:hypothetical protein